jgi:ketosteroid isomerase-like protein
MLHADLSSKGGRMADHPNVERLRRGYEAYAKGDLAALRDMFADTITFHFLGHTQLSGAYHGLSEVLGYFERVEEVGGAFRFEVHDLLADDEHGVALLAGTAERTGERIEQKVAAAQTCIAARREAGHWCFPSSRQLMAPVRAGSARHQEPLVPCGHERSPSVSRDRRSRAVHRYDLGRRSIMGPGSNLSASATNGGRPIATLVTGPPAVAACSG